MAATAQFIGASQSAVQSSTGRLTAVLPTGTQVGDLLIAISGTSSYSQYDPVSPASGFSYVGGVTPPGDANRIKARLFVKKVIASDLTNGAYLDITQASYSHQLLLFSYRLPAVAMTNNGYPRFASVDQNTTGQGPLAPNPQPREQLIHFSANIDSTPFLQNAQGWNDRSSAGSYISARLFDRQAPLSPPASYAVPQVSRSASGTVFFMTGTLIYPMNSAPLAPLLGGPATGSTVDSKQPITLDWTPQEPDADPQTAWEVQYRVAGADADWTVQSSTAENGTATAWTPPTGFFAGGIEWSVRTRDDMNVWGPFAASKTFVAAPGGSSGGGGGGSASGGGGAISPALLGALGTIGTPAQAADSAGSLLQRLAAAVAPRKQATGAPGSALAPAIYGAQVNNTSGAWVQMFVASRACYIAGVYLNYVPNQGNNNTYREYQMRLAVGAAGVEQQIADFRLPQFDLLRQYLRLPNLAGAAIPIAAGERVSFVTDYDSSRGGSGWQLVVIPQ